VMRDEMPVMRDEMPVMRGEMPMMRGEMPRGMTAPPEDLMRSMFARRFGPSLSYSARGDAQLEDAPRGMPFPLMSLIRPFSGMPPFLSGRMSPRVTYLPSTRIVSDEEEEPEQGPTEVDLAQLQRGAGLFTQPEPEPFVRAMPFMRAFPIRLSIFRQLPADETDEIPEEVQVLPRNPSFIRRMRPEEEEEMPNMQKKEWMQKKAWMKKAARNKQDLTKEQAQVLLMKQEGRDGRWGKDGEKEWMDVGEAGGWKQEGRKGYYHDDDDDHHGHHFGGGWMMGGHHHPRREGEPRHPPAGLCALVFVGVVLAMTLTCCCCTRRPRTSEDGDLMVDVVGVDAYTPLMNTCTEQEAECEKPLMPLDFEEPIKAPLASK